MTLKTLRDLVDGLAARGSQPAIVTVAGDATTTIDYATLGDRALRLAGALVAQGVARGEPVFLLGPNSADWIAVRLALAAIGAVAVALDDLSTAAELTVLIPDSGAVRGFVSRAHLPTVRALEHGETLALHLLDGDAIELGAPPWQRLLGAAQAPLPPIAPDDPAMLVYTSGTTGSPKSFPLSHANLLANIEAIVAMKVVGPGDRALLPLPLHHVYPLLVGVLTQLGAGTAVVLPEGVAGPQIVRALRAGEVTLLIGVPRLYAALAAAIEARIATRGALARRLFRLMLGASIAADRRLHWSLGRALFGSLHRQMAPTLRLLVSGGAKLEAELVWRLRGLGWAVLSGYGLAETSSILTGVRPAEVRVGSEGYPLQGAGLRIADPDAAGVGEIEVRGPSVFAGYRSPAEANAAAFTGDGWFRTGDLGTVDADGFLTVTGRVKEMIVLGGGKKVFPEELEQVYAGSPYIRELAVLEQSGALVALVVPELDKIAASGNLQVADVLRVALTERTSTLPSYQRLAGYALTREPLPRTRLGKYQRFRLPALYASAKAGAAPTVTAELTSADRAFLAEPLIAALWAWLKARYPDKTIGLETSPQLDLGIDSLEWVTITLELEQRFGCHLAEEDASRIATVRDLLRVAAEAQGNLVAPTPTTLTAEQESWLAPPAPLYRLLGLGLQAVVRLVLRFGFRLRVEGREHLPAKAPFVIACNHVSDLDPAIVAIALRPAQLRDLHWGGDRGRLFTSGWGRLLARIARIFPVDERTPAVTLALARRVLEQGEALAWFPESWRSPTGELQRFLPGIGVVLADSGPAVIPARIFGAFEAWPRDRRWPRLHPVRIVFGAAVSPDQLAAEGPGETRPLRIAAALQARVAGLA